MKLMRWTVVLLAALGVFALAAPEASAQASADAGASASREADTEAFWANRRGVRTVQRRLYSTDGDFQLSLYFGAIPNDPFLKYFPIGLRFGYWVSESVSVELSGSYIGDALRSQTDLADFLAETGEIDVFLRDEQLWRANVVALWSPIYGKFSFLGTKLAHFDWYFGAGVGVLSVRNPISTTQLNETETGFSPEVVLATGWNLHLHRNWAARIDYRQFIFMKDAGGVSLPSEISLGASFFF